MGVKLQKLKKKLPNLIKAAYAPRTWAKYNKAWAGWSTWCKNNGVKEICPAAELQVALYLAFVFESKRKRGPLSDAINGINWGHTVAGLPSPTKSNFVKKVLEGAKRRCKKVKNKKDPLEVNVI